MTDHAISLANIVKSYGASTIIPGLTAELGGGEFTVILGPSGCGKSTLLNMIAGLEEVSGGTIRIGNAEVQDMAPKDRGCAMVFQNYALYPHMSVAANIGYSLKVAKVPKPERDRRVAEAADIVDLAGLLDRKPSQMSGGQRQRVAIARAIVREPKVLLFDEPLSNLDAKLRHGMRKELSQLHDRIGTTSVFVTHDQVEAMTLADKILILDKGQIEQFDTPNQIYNHPASVFVASFIGSPPMNLIEVTGDGQNLTDTAGTVLASLLHTGPATLGVRPEKLRFSDTGIPFEVTYREDLGSHTIILGTLPNGQEINVATPIGDSRVGADRLMLQFNKEDLHLFDSTTGRRIEGQV
ncbi:sn-glycerol-3-phosphate ABC transporter ATP-binding protein UgpC [Pacificibacter sp. AS14]|uniref:ABC transporter ATP-binding protein n=1 Tax=Pacificibacter sp. AS14 TaxID=3135785 RepID=UPI00317AAA68